MCFMSAHKKKASSFKAPLTGWQAALGVTTESLRKRDRERESLKGRKKQNKQKKKERKTVFQFLVELLFLLYSESWFAVFERCPDLHSYSDIRNEKLPSTTTVLWSSDSQAFGLARGSDPQCGNHCSRAGHWKALLELLEVALITGISTIVVQGMFLTHNLLYSCKRTFLVKHFVTWTAYFYCLPCDHCD